jgi:hypothetical protein
MTDYIEQICVICKSIFYCKGVCKCIGHNVVCHCIKCSKNGNYDIANCGKISSIEEVIAMEL